MTHTQPARFRDQAIAFDGRAGADRRHPLRFPAQLPPGDHPPRRDAAVTSTASCSSPRSSGAAKLPLVMIVPGSLGVAPSHVAHAETLTRAGFATFVLDSFAARGVTSTVANQTQFSFAASAYDVLAAWKVLAALPEIDASRIGAQGHSRGGSAVLTAATRRFADAVIGRICGIARRACRLSLERTPVLRSARRRDNGARADGRRRRMVFADAGAGSLPGDPRLRRRRRRCG